MSATSTMATQVTLVDCIQSSLMHAKELFARVTMTPNDMAKAIEKQKFELVMQARVEARNMRNSWASLKDPDDRAVQPLEAFEDKEQRYLAKGRELDAKVKALLAGEMTEDDQQVKDIRTQLNQLATGLKSLREGPMGLMKQTYDTALSTYQLALKTLATREAEYSLVKNNLPMVIAALKVNETALKDRERVAREAALASSGGSSGFMDKMNAQLQTAALSVRSEDALDKDMDAFKAPNPDDLLADLEGGSANADILAEFAAK